MLALRLRLRFLHSSSEKVRASHAHCARLITPSPKTPYSTTFGRVPPFSSVPPSITWRHARARARASIYHLPFDKTGKVVVFGNKLVCEAVRHSGVLNNLSDMYNNGLHEQRVGALLYSIQCHDRKDSVDARGNERSR